MISFMRITVSGFLTLDTSRWMPTSLQTLRGKHSHERERYVGTVPSGACNMTMLDPRHLLREEIPTERND